MNLKTNQLYEVTTPSREKILVQTLGKGSNFVLSLMILGCIQVHNAKNSKQMKTVAEGEKLYLNTFKCKFEEVTS